MFHKKRSSSAVLEKKRRCGKFAALSVAAVLILAGCSGKDSSQNAPSGQIKSPQAAQPALAPVKKLAGNTASGKELYLKYCHYCHGQKGLGDGPVGIALTPHPADFVNDAKRMSKTDEELYKSISEGIHRQIGGEALAMPRWQEIMTEQERWDVLAYIRLLEREGKKSQ